MRGPMPGIARIWASVAVLMLIGVIAAVLLVVVPPAVAPPAAVPPVVVPPVVAPVVVPAVAPVVGIVDVDVDAVIDVSAAIAVVSAALSGFAVQAASAIAAASDRKFVNRLIRISGKSRGLGVAAPGEGRLPVGV